MGSWVFFKSAVGLSPHESWGLPFWDPWVGLKLGLWGLELRSFRVATSGLLAFRFRVSFRVTLGSSIRT